MDLEPNEIVASTIRAELARRSRTHSDLARHLGVTQSAVSKRLRGDRSISVDELYAIADYLGLPPTALLPTEVAAA